MKITVTVFCCQQNTVLFYTNMGNWACQHNRFNGYVRNCKVDRLGKEN